MPVLPNKKANVLIVVDGLKLGGLARVMIDLSSGFAAKGVHIGMIVLAPRIDYDMTTSEWMRVYPEIEPTFGPLSQRDDLSASLAFAALLPQARQ